MAPKLKLKAEAEADLYSQEIEDAQKRVERHGAAVASLGRGITTLITEPLLRLAAPARAAAEGHRQALNSLRLSTGATGAQLDALASVYDQVRADAREGVGAAAGVVGDFSVVLGLTGDDLRTASAAALRAVSGGGDIKPAVLTLAKTMSAWGVTSHAVGETINRLRAAGAVAEGGFSGLVTRLGAAAPTLKLAGLSIDASAGLLADLERAGVPADVALTGLTKALTELAKIGTSDIPTALRTQIEAIRNAPAAAAASQIAAGLFGRSSVAIADAIRLRGALSLDRLNQLAGNTPGPAAMSKLLRASEDLRIKLEQALEPLGQAIENLVIPATHALVAALGLAVDVVSAVTHAFDALPDGVKTAIVAIAGIAVIVGPALLFAASITELLVAFVGKHLATILALDIIPTALTALARAGVAGAVIGYRRVNDALPSLAGAGVAAAVTAGGVALTGAAATAQAAVEQLAPAAAQALQGAAAKTVGPAPEVSTPLVPIKLAAAPTFSIAPIILPTINEPPPRYFEEPPLIDMPWISAYDWQRQFTDALNTPTLWPTQGNIWSSDYSDLRYTLASKSADEIAYRLEQIGRLKGVTFNLSRQAQASEVQRAIAMLTPGDSMRVHAWDMEKTYGQLNLMGVMVGPVAVGAWLDSNSPAAWRQRADEMDRLMAAQTAATSFFVDLRAANDSYWIQQWTEKNFALGMAFGPPRPVTSAEVFAGITQGLQEAFGATTPTTMWGGASPARTTPAARASEPMAGAPPATAAATQALRANTGATASAHEPFAAAASAPPPTPAAGGGALTEPQLWVRHEADGFWPLVRSGGDAVAMRRSGDWRFFDPEYSTPPRELFYRGESGGYPVFAYGDGRMYPGSSVDEVAVIRADRRAPAAGGGAA